MVNDHSGQSHPTLEEAHDVLTPEETAKVLRIGRNATYEAIQRGEIPSVRIGRKIRVPKLALQRMLGEVTRKE
jgi:excisionase family DNA binding protein